MHSAKSKIITYHDNQSTGIGGIEVLIRNIQNLFNKPKYEITEIYFGLSGDKTTKANKHVKNIKLKQISYIPKKVNNLFNKIRFGVILQQEKLCKKDYVLIFNAMDLLFISNNTLSKTNIILVQSNRSDIFLPKITPLSFFIKHKLNKLYKLTCYTEYDQKEIIELTNIQNALLKIIPRGCKVDTSSELREHSYKLVTITRIYEKQKNLMEMIEIVKSLPKDYTLDIWGPGNEEEVLALEDAIKDQCRINYLGPCFDVVKCLNNYSLFIMTSHFEGYGQTLIEARSQGLPLVVYETFPALKSIIKNNYNGIRIKAYDRLEFINAILTITSNQNSYLEYSKNALSSAKSTEQKYINNLWKEVIH